MALTLAIVGKTVFGADVERDARDVGDALATLLHTLDSLVLFVIFMTGGGLADRVESLPLPSMQRFRKARDELYRIIQRLIDERRREGAQGSDLLSSLLAVKEDGAGMSDEQIRDEAITIFLAGHETTAVALSWTFYLLSRHPHVAEKLHAELGEVLGENVPTV